MQNNAQIARTYFRDGPDTITKPLTAPERIYCGADNRTRSIGEAAAKAGQAATSLGCQRGQDIHRTFHQSLYEAEVHSSASVPLLSVPSAYTTADRPVYRQTCQLLCLLVNRTGQPHIERLPSISKHQQGSKLKWVSARCQLGPSVTGQGHSCMLMYVQLSEPCLDHTIPSGWNAQICGQWLCSWANMIIACIIHASP